MQTHERAGILNALRGLPEDLAAISPGPGRWSAIECVEHSQAQRSEAPVVNQTREAAILARGADRTSPVSNLAGSGPTHRTLPHAGGSGGELSGPPRTDRPVRRDLRRRSSLQAGRHALQISEIGSGLVRLRPLT